MTSEHIRQMRELRAEKNKLEAERDHWMNEAIELRRDLESLKQSETDLVNEAMAVVEALRWYIAEDETNEGDEEMPDYGGRSWNEINAYWIAGKRQAIDALNKWESSRK